MEVATLMLAAIMPVAVTWATNYVKQIKPLPEADNRVLWVRAAVAVLAVLGAVLTQVAGGAVVDGGLVETAILAVFNAGMATWLYQNRK